MTDPRLELMVHLMKWRLLLLVMLFVFLSCTSNSFNICDQPLSEILKYTRDTSEAPVEDYSRLALSASALDQLHYIGRGRRDACARLRRP